MMRVREHSTATCMPLLLCCSCLTAAQWQGGCQPAAHSGVSGPGGNMLPGRADVMDFQGALVAVPSSLGAGALAAFWPAAGTGRKGASGSTATRLGAEAWLALLEEGPPEDVMSSTVWGLELAPLPRGTMEYSMRLGVPSASTLPLTCRAAGGVSMDLAEQTGVALQGLPGVGCVVWPPLSSAMLSMTLPT